MFGEGDSDGSAGWIGRDRPSSGCYRSSSGWMQRQYQIGKVAVLIVPVACSVVLAAQAVWQML